ncbi:Acetylornithine/succinyldiaminopimelate aminotransferase [Methylobacterium isbiliense]|uniref:Acetylornithine/succinyldiaminopimelate aminotransferase n=1 Tax=Methylobacterium isbiliense TaxID=315478 RepID=A0ABQ4SI92_9HYPH|nr:Acetylornithine/succinyldiaminopimelate aminotransferase [Methylobacterium isbiliense]
MIIEPVAGSTSFPLTRKGYPERLCGTAGRPGILRMLDEAITDIGRLNAPFAAAYFDLTSDLVTTVKGLTNGTIPLGADFTIGRCTMALFVARSRRSTFVRAKYTQFSFKPLLN